MLKILASLHCKFLMERSEEDGSQWFTVKGQEAMGMN